MHTSLVSATLLALMITVGQPLHKLRRVRRPKRANLTRRQFPRPAPIKQMPRAYMARREKNSDMNANTPAARLCSACTRANADPAVSWPRLRIGGHYFGGMPRRTHPKKPANL